MIKQKKDLNLGTRAFTLVELIVVITILAILWTISFISLQWYSKTARDSTRISDLSAMKTSLELFHLDSWKYPNPTDTFWVAYSWAIVWNQWTFWTDTTNNVDKLDRVPLDPLTGKEYTYSLTNPKQEYQLAWLMEYSDMVLNTLNTKVNAWETIATAIVTWNYNWQIIKTQTWWNCEVLSVPSIISSEEKTVTDLKTILDSERLVYNWYNNLPSNYVWSKYKTDEWFNFEPKQLVVYSDDKECLPLYWEDPLPRIGLVRNIQTSYSWTIIENNDNISWIVNLDTSDTDAVILLSTTFVNNNLWGNIPTKQLNNTDSFALVDWVCWTSNNVPKSSTPSTYLCEEWTKTAVISGTNQYTWECEWINFWETVNCSAPRIYIATLNANWWSLWTTNVSATYWASMPTLATAPTRTWYTFNWYYSATSWWTKYYNANKTSANNWDLTTSTTLYAQWTVNTYNVTFSANWWTIWTSSAVATYWSTMPTLATSPTRLWYTFNWYYSATSWWTKYYNADKTSANTWNIAANTTLYAQRTASTYTVTFNANWWSLWTTSVVATYWSTMPTLATAPTRPWYTFNWYFSATSWWTKYYNSNKTSATTYTLTSTTTLYAQWTVGTYTVTLNANGWTLWTTSVIATYNLAMPTLTTAPTKTWYVFNWYFSATSWWTKYYNADRSSAKTYTLTWNTTLYAQWSFMTTCNWTQYITYAQAVANKTTIKAQINNYLWCNISDYPWGANSRIAWITMTNYILVAASGDSGSKMWWCYWTDLPMTNNNTTDWVTNTNWMISWCSTSTSYPAGLCRSKWSNWFVPAKNEMNTFYLQRSYIWGINTSDARYWSSTEAHTYYARALFTKYGNWYWTDLGQWAKSYSHLVRCASRF